MTLRTRLSGPAAILAGSLWLATALVAPSPAIAQSPPSADIDIFHPSPHLTDDVVIGTNKTLRHLQMSTAAMLSWSHVTLQIEGARDSKVILEDRLKSDFSVALGLFDVMEIGLGLPVVLYNDALDDPSNGLEPRVAGHGDAAISVKARIFNGCGQLLDRWSMGFVPPWQMSLGAQLRITVPSGDDESLFGSNGLRIHPKLVWSALPHHRLALGVDAGFRVRTAEDRLLDVRIGHEFTWAVSAAAILIQGKLSIHGALHSALPLDPDRIDRAVLNPYEANLWARFSPTPGLQLFFGGGSGLIRSGYGNPDIRVFAGIGTTFRVMPDGVPEDLDADGVPDAWDRCICSPDVL